MLYQGFRPRHHTISGDIYEKNSDSMDCYGWSFFSFSCSMENIDVPASVEELSTDNDENSSVNNLPNIGKEESSRRILNQIEKVLESHPELRMYYGGSFFTEKKEPSVAIVHDNQELKNLLEDEVIKDTIVYKTCEYAYDDLKKRYDNIIETHRKLTMNKDTNPQEVNLFLERIESIGLNIQDNRIDVVLIDGEKEDMILFGELFDGMNMVVIFPFEK